MPLVANSSRTFTNLSSNLFAFSLCLLSLYSSLSVSRLFSVPSSIVSVKTFTDPILLE